MRVLFIAGTFPPGRCGVGDYVARLAGELASLPQVQVGVLTQQAQNRAAPAGVDVIGIARSWRLYELPRLVREIRRWKPDLVHIHWPSQGFGWRLLPALLPAICKRIGITVVQTWHEPWPAKDVLRFYLQRSAANGLVFVRPGFESLMPARLMKWMPVCPRRTIGSAGVLPVSSLTEDGAERLRLNYLKGRKVLVVFFGFVYPEKGIEQLFDIAEPGSHALVIAGQVLDEAYRRQLDDLARARGWEDQVQYTGFLPREVAADLLRAADAVVLPFLSGGGDWNTSIHGALDQGTAVITTAANPRGDEPLRNLYTARISDVAEMREALRAIAGRRVAAQSEDGWTRIARAHTDFYAEVLSRHQR
jgi:glycosyltransferase involved in cell wall biosynthesis